MIASQGPPSLRRDHLVLCYCKKRATASRICRVSRPARDLEVVVAGEGRIVALFQRSAAVRTDVLPFREHAGHGAGLHRNQLIGWIRYSTQAACLYSAQAGGVQRSHDILLHRASLLPGLMLV